jgi:hypothetical protein
MIPPKSADWAAYDFRFPEAYEWERSLDEGAKEGLGPSA